jgi:hypothetical protein
MPAFALLPRELWFGSGIMPSGGKNHLMLLVSSFNIKGNKCFRAITPEQV